MVDRIKTLQNHFGYSATQMSEVLGVPKATMSHIFSGRNKPSLDFVMKILASFPTISGDWLLLGHGDMIRTETIDFKASSLEDVLDQCKNANSDVSKIIAFYENGTFKEF